MKNKILKILSDLDIQKLNKNNLIALLFLYDILSNKKFLEKLYDKVNILDLEKPNSVDAKIRIDAFLKDYSDKKYLNKVEDVQKGFILYEYEDRYDLFFNKDINLDNIDVFTKNLNFLIVEVYNKIKLKFQLVFVIDLKNNNNDTIDERQLNIKKTFLEIKLDSYDCFFIKLSF